MVDDLDAVLRGAFPADVDPPELLFKFARWLGARPAEQVGPYVLSPRSAADFVPSGIEIADDFALMFDLGDGSAAGLWFGQTRDAARAPFVVMGSEGGVEMLAPNLASMLHRIGVDTFENGSIAADFAFPAQKAEASSELLAWLQSDSEAWSLIEETRPEDYLSCDDGSAAAWLSERIQAHEDTQRADPDLAAIAAILIDAGYAPKPAVVSEPAASVSYVPPTAFRVYAAGAKMRVMLGAALVPEAAHLLQPLPEAVEMALCPHLARLRIGFAENHRGAGLWPVAALALNHEGLASLEPIWSHGYPMGYDEFPADAFAEDQARYPRDADKMPSWLSARIAQAD